MGLFADILKEIPTTSVARERMALAEQKYEMLERENEVLKQETARLKGDLESLRRQVPSTEWVEARGVAFKRRSDGTLEPDAYCPDCKRAMRALDPEMPLRCSKCKYLAPFETPRLAEIISVLQGS